MKLSIFLVWCVALGCTAADRGKNHDHGRKFSFSRIGDKECHFQYTRVDFEDGSFTDVINDLDREVGVVRLSTSPDACYVRDVAGARRRCLKPGNTTEQEQGSTGQNYTRGGQLVAISDLSEQLQAACANRTVYRVTVVNGTENSGDKKGGHHHGDGGHNRQDRQDEGDETCTPVEECWLCSCEEKFRVKTCKTCCIENCILERR